MRFKSSVIVLAILVGSLSLLGACGASREPTATVTEEDVAEQAPAEQEPSEGTETNGLRTFVVDTEQSSASYIVDEEFLPDMLSKYGIEAGRQDTVGTTPEVTGRLELNLDDLSSPLGVNEFQADLSRLESDQSLRDEWLQNRGPQFSQYPTASFVATSVQNAPESYSEGDLAQFQLNGDLTIREITQPATFDVEATLDGDRLTGTATADLRMTDFDIEPPDFANTLVVQDEFQIRIDFEAAEE